MPPAAALGAIAITPEEMALFQDLMYREAGIRLADAKGNLVQGRLQRRVEALGLGSFRAYHAHIRDPAHADEFQRCLEALTTNETFFFRHQQHWDFILGTLLPEWLAGVRPGAVYRAWSAASSTGEEPYSLAIALAETFASRGVKGSVEATDINTQVLERARTAIYGAYALQKLTPYALQRFFTPVGGERHQVRPEVRALVEFRRHNLLDAARGGPFDLVLLRNVLIYFDAASKAAVLGRIAERIRPGGWLILGGAESLSHGAFAYVRPTIYRKRP